MTIKKIYVIISLFLLKFMLGDILLNFALCEEQIADSSSGPIPEKEKIASSNNYDTYFALALVIGLGIALYFVFSYTGGSPSEGSSSILPSVSDVAQTKASNINENITNSLQQQLAESKNTNIGFRNLLDKNNSKFLALKQRHDILLEDYRALKCCVQDLTSLLNSLSNIDPNIGKTTSQILANYGKKT